MPNTMNRFLSTAFWCAFLFATASAESCNDVIHESLEQVYGYENGRYNCATVLMQGAQMRDQSPTVSYGFHGRKMTGPIKLGGAGNYYIDFTTEVSFSDRNNFSTSRTDTQQIRLNSSPFVRVTLKDWGNTRFQFRPSNCERLGNDGKFLVQGYYESGNRITGYTFMVDPIGRCPDPVL